MAADDEAPKKKATKKKSTAKKSTAKKSTAKKRATKKKVEEAPPEPVATAAPEPEPVESAPPPARLCVNCGEVAVFTTSGRYAAQRSFCGKHMPANRT